MADDLTPDQRLARGGLIPGNPGNKGGRGGGRLPKAIRESLRNDFDETSAILKEIAQDAMHSPEVRRACIDTMGKYGLGAAVVNLDDDGNAVVPQIVVRREKVDKIKHAHDCPCDVCVMSRRPIDPNGRTEL